MKRFKNWLINKFLPAWAKEELWEENRRLREKCEKLQQEIELQERYIAGMHDAMRLQRNITIKNTTNTTSTKEAAEK